MSDLPTTGDSVAPTALNFNPTDEALGVAVASNIVITFSEAVQLGAGTIVLKNASGTVIETFSLANSGNVSISGDVLTVNPTLNFGFNTGYTVEFAPDSVKDLAGNNYAGTTSYNFTTVSGGNGSPTGAITIVGTPTQGQTLSANTSTLADADGLGSFSYLWQAGGVAIAGANAANYTLTQSEVGKAITVTVSYTDSTGTAESMSSSQTAVVAGSGTTTNAALASFVAEFDNNTQSMVGNVELNGALYVFSTKLISITNFRTDPDGTKSYLTSVVVTKIGNGQVLAQTEVAQLYVGGADSSSNNNSALARGVIGVANGNVKVFFNEKDSGSAYGQNGYSYLLTAQSLTSTASTLFSNANWGWYPRIDSNGDVLHFSYAGYYLYKNTTLQNALQPADAVLPAENQKLVTAGLNGNLTTSISADALSCP